MKTLPLLGRRLASGSSRQALAELTAAAAHDEGGYAVFCNVHMLVSARSDRLLARAMDAARWAFPDGRPVAKALNLRHPGQRSELVAGMDVMRAVCHICAHAGWSVYLFGGQAATLERLAHCLPQDYPGLRIAGTCSPPYRSFSAMDNAAFVRAINQSGARFCLVALGCPKQECWMAAQATRLRPVLLGVGGAFPIWAGEQRRAPQWLRRAYLEWLYRLVQEPRRLWRRYAVTNPRFVNLLLRDLWTRSPREPLSPPR